MANQRNDGSNKTAHQEIVLQKHEPLKADITRQMKFFRIPPERFAGPISCNKVLGYVFLLNLARTYADKIPKELCIF